MDLDLPKITSLDQRFVFRKDSFKGRFKLEIAGDDERSRSYSAKELLTQAVVYVNQRFAAHQLGQEMRQHQMHDQIFRLAKKIKSEEIYQLADRVSVPAFPFFALLNELQALVVSSFVDTKGLVKLSQTSKGMQGVIYSNTFYLARILLRKARSFVSLAVSDETRRMFNFRNIALCYAMMGEVEEVLESVSLIKSKDRQDDVLEEMVETLTGVDLEEAKNILPHIQDKKKKVFALIHIASFKYKNNMMVDALRTAQRAEHIASSISDPYHECLAYIRIARFYAFHMKVDETQKIATIIKEKLPLIGDQNHRYNILVGLCYILTKIKNVNEAYEMADQIREGNLNAYFKMVEAALSNEDIKGAKSTCRRYLNLNAQEGDRLLFSILIYQIEKEDLVEAQKTIANMRDAVEKAEAIVHFAKSAKKNVEQAIGMLIGLRFLFVPTQNPKKISLLLEMALAFADLKAFNEAISVIRTIDIGKLGEHDFEHQPFQNTFRRIVFAQAMKEGFSEAFKTVSILDEDHFKDLRTLKRVKNQAYVQLAKFHALQGDVEKAYQTYELIQDTRETAFRPKALSKMAKSFWKAGKFNEAREALERISYPEDKNEEHFLRAEGLIKLVRVILSKK